MVKREVVRDPFPGALVFIIEVHEKHRVDGVNDGVANAVPAPKVRASVAQRVIFIVPHGVLLCAEHKLEGRCKSNARYIPYACHAH